MKKIKKKFGKTIDKYTKFVYNIDTVKDKEQSKKTRKIMIMTKLNRNELKNINAALKENHFTTKATQANTGLYPNESTKSVTVTFPHTKVFVELVNEEVVKVSL